MKQPSVNSTADPEIRVRFQAQLAEAHATPVLSRLVRRPTADLYPRYSGYYRQLCQLPRRVRRQLQRQWRRSLSAIALLLALGQAPALAATINVDGTNCTLADAIRSANTNTAVGGCTKGSGADTIVLPIGSTQSLAAVDNTTLGPTGLPVITSKITIQGHNSTIRRESNAPNFRILAVASSGNLTLHSATVSGGSAGFYLPGGGDGVFNSGTLTLTHSRVSGNSGYSSGVFNSGTATLTHSTVSGNGGNYGYGYGGMHNSGTATMIHSTVSGNGGGGLRNSGTLTLTNSTVSGNVSQGNAGISNGGHLTVTNSTVAGNRVFYCGHCGGIGGIDNRGTLTLTNSTVSGNSGDVGGVSNSGILTLARTLISGNIGIPHAPPYSPSVEVGTTGSPATIVADNHNLFGHDGDPGVVGFSPGPTDIVPNAPLSAILKPLADNGGPTKTHALPAGSPALNASPANSGCKPTDQRGVTRPQGAACDIGAFEQGPPVLCNGQIARILGTVGNERLVGTPGPDVIHGLAGRDIIDGLEGNDIICGGSGADRLNRRQRRGCTQRR